MECWEGRILWSPQRWTPRVAEDGTFLLDLLSSLPLRLQPLVPSPAPFSQAKDPRLFPPSSLPPVLHLLSLLPLRCVPLVHRSVPRLELHCSPTSSPLPPLPLLLSALLRPFHCLLLSTEEEGDSERPLEGQQPAVPPLLFAVWLRSGDVVVAERLLADAAAVSQKEGTAASPLNLEWPSDWTEEATAEQRMPGSDGEGPMVESRAAAEERRRRRRERLLERQRSRREFLQPLLRLSQQTAIDQATATVRATDSRRFSASAASTPSTPSPPSPSPSPPVAPPVVSSPSPCPAPHPPPPPRPPSNTSLSLSLFRAAAARLRRPVSDDAALAMALTVVEQCRREVGEERWNTAPVLTRAQLHRLMKPHVSRVIRQYLAFQRST